MESLPNIEVRMAIMKNNIPKWKIAEKLGIADTSFSRKLRYEMKEEDKKKILDVIEKIANS